MYTKESKKLEKLGYINISTEETSTNIENNS